MGTTRTRITRSAAAAVTTLALLAPAAQSAGLSEAQALASRGQSAPAGLSEAQVLASRGQAAPAPAPAVAEEGTPFTMGATALGATVSAALLLLGAGTVTAGRRNRTRVAR